jgi:methyl-accepting chemotaxis protein
MTTWFKNLKLATRIVVVTLLIVISVVAVNYVVFVQRYQSSAEAALLEKARAFSAVADEAKNHTSLLHRIGAFDTQVLSAELAKDLQSGKKVEQTRMFKAIPVVAGWTAAQEAAAREKIEFRISAFDARNKANEPKPGSFDERLLRDLTAQVASGKEDFVHAINPEDNSLHFLRAIRLTDNCLICHGDPGSANDLNKTGKDLTGFKMEGWKAGQMHGSYHVVMPLAPVKAQVASFIAHGMIWTLPLVVVAVAALIYLLGVVVRRPVAALTERTVAIARGDLTQEVPAELQQRQDEIGELARALSGLSQALRSSLLEVLNSTGTLAVMSDGLLSTSHRLTAGAKGTSERANAVAAAAEQASANTVSVAAAMEQASTNLTSVASATEELSATVADIATNSARARAVSEQAGNQAQAVAALVSKLGQAAREIGKVTETITAISSQTNLLALNATIEAARAGTAGKGFAVVANEIKDLAKQTAVATEDIKSKIAGVQTSTNDAISDIEKITGVIREVGDLVSSIAAAIEEQTAVTKDVAGNVTQASTGVREANERIAETATVSKSIAQDITEVSTQGRAMNNDSIHLQEDADMLRRVTERLHELSARFELGSQTDFAAIKRAHLQWRGRLVEMFEGRTTLSPQDLADHHGCALGKWYDGEGASLCRQCASFAEMASRHEEFHRLVSDIVSHWNTGRREEAQSLMKRVIPITADLFVLLDRLSLEAGQVAPSGNDDPFESGGPTHRNGSRPNGNGSHASNGSRNRDMALTH